MKTYVTNGTKKEVNAMGKTKAEIIAEYRDLKKENLKLNNQLEHWKAIARKENDRVVDLAAELDGKTEELTKWVKSSREKEETIARLSVDLEECEKEKSLIKSQRDNLLLEHEKSLQEITEIQDDLEILQAEVRKIQFDEENIRNQAYDEGYALAKCNYSKALQASHSQIHSLIGKVDRLTWIIDQIYENQKG